MRVRLSEEITGPICTPSSSPDPVTRRDARSPMASVNEALASPTATANDEARHRCPAQPKAASAMTSAAADMSASGMTMTGFLAPPWHCTRLPAAEAREYTWRATLLDPTKLTERITG